MRKILMGAVLALGILWLAFNISIPTFPGITNHIQPGGDCFIFSENAGFLSNSIYHGFWQEVLPGEPGSAPHVWVCEAALISGPGVYGERRQGYESKHDTTRHDYVFKGKAASWVLAEPVTSQQP